ncbi:sigma-70 family RNA polymerase sigma factor [Leifsonia poae]|uniref:sigma-70 family RNA polymerase sigma factor n=1 Tax=Leifsonia poae TaxID=110933 RepID=UPI003D679E12
MGERRTRVDNTSLSDAELLYRLRSGHNDAYGELWNRHSKAGISVARSVTSSLDPDDLVSEAFAKILTTIKRGNGPEGAFRPYLYTTIRNVAATWGGRQRESTTLHEIEMHLEDPRFSEESTVAGLDRALILTAFKSLNPRWQEVLWYLEVEAMKPADIAPLLGMKPTAVSMLGSRAREGLRKAWIEAHISNVPDESECQWVFGHLGARARGTLKPKDRARMEAHLDEHEQCRTIAAEAETVGSRLAVAILPVVLGVGGAAALLAQESAHPAAASAPARHVTEATRLTPTWIAAAAVTAVVAVASAAIALAAPHAGHPGSSGPRHAQTDLATPDLGEQAPPPVEIKVSPSAPQSDPVPSSPQPYPVMPPLKVSPEAPSWRRQTRLIRQCFPRSRYRRRARSFLSS